MWGAIMLVIATFLGLLMLWRENDIPYVLVFIWAFIGIANKQAETALVANTAWLASAVLMIAIVFVFIIKQRSKRSG